MKIPFNKPYMTGKELWNIAQANVNGHMAGDGPFTDLCHKWLEKITSTNKALLTHSCTSALEMTALLANIEPGDEVIMPSYTFVSTATAFVNRGAVPVFVDIRPDTFNIDERKIECAITNKTKAIVPVHYAGVGCEMDAILEIASNYNLIVIEDAAQGVMSSYKGKALGSIGHLGAFSFHETKNIISGEGGALLINDSKFAHRAEIIREKGTNRSEFFRGAVDKYTWVDIGSSYLPGEIIAAFLHAQMEEAELITKSRLSIWRKYNRELKCVADNEKIKQPSIPEHCKHNAHMYQILLPNLKARNEFISKLAEKNINTVFHYVPLHNSPAGMRFGRTNGTLDVTENISDRLVRLPLWVGLESKLDFVISNIIETLS